MRRGEGPVRGDSSSQTKGDPRSILTRDSIIEYLGEITVAPVTSTIRDIPSEVALSPLDGVPRYCAINLDHIQTVSKGKSRARSFPHSLSRKWTTYSPGPALCPRFRWCKLAPPVWRVIVLSRLTGALSPAILAGTISSARHPVRSTGAAALHQRLNVRVQTENMVPVPSDGRS